MVLFLWLLLYTRSYTPSYTPSSAPSRYTNARQEFQLALGPAGSGAPLHWHFDAVNALLDGTKEWVMHPPTGRQDRSTGSSTGGTGDTGGTGGTGGTGVTQSDAPYDRVPMYIFDGSEGSGSDGSGSDGDDNGDYNGGSGTAAAATGKEGEEGEEGDAGAAKKNTRKETKSKETDKRSRKKMLYCVQQAGDVIYVPEGFAHGTRHPPGGGRHGGVGIAFEFRQRGDAQACSVK